MIYFIAWVVIAWGCCMALAITLGKENSYDPQQHPGQAHRIDR